MEHFYNPVRITQGVGCLQELGGLIETLQPSSILVLAYQQELFEDPVLQQVRLQHSKINWYLEAVRVSNPDIRDLEAMYQTYRKQKPELVIGIGGGSVLDLAKSLCMVLGEDDLTLETMREKIAAKSFHQPYCPWIGIPTTFGTGSEVTCWATIWDRELDCKRSLEAKSNYAYAVLVDSKLGEKMPFALMVSSALDALMHAIEAYWSKHTNLISRLYALKAIECGKQAIDRIVHQQGSLQEVDDIAKASLLAGLAFSNTKTTACHSISYPLTLHYGIPHGVAVSLLFGPVARKNSGHYPDEQRLYQALGVSDINEAEDFIKTSLAKAGYATKLNQWGGQKEDLKPLVEHCFTAGRMENNPYDLTNEDVLEILESIFEEERR